MSLKLKMIMGYVIILVMVMVQSYLIVSMNGKRDVMSQQALALFQMNVVMKDRVIELTSLENDLLNLIQTKQAIPETKSGKDAQRKSCVMYFIALTQWHDAFLTSNSYAAMNDALKQKVLDMKPFLGDIGRAALLAADRVEQKLVVRDAGVLGDEVHHRDDLVVVERVVAAEELRAELVELAKLQRQRIDQQAELIAALERQSELAGQITQAKDDSAELRQQVV